MRNFEMKDVQRNTDCIHKKEQKRSFCVFFFGGGGYNSEDELFEQRLPTLNCYKHY